MKRIIMIAALLVLATGAASQATLGMGARATGMGGAYTSLVNDETAIFWNPAMLNYQQENFSMSLPAFGLSYVSSLDREDIDDLSGDEVETIGNANLLLESSGMIGFQANRWGVGVLANIDGMADLQGSNLSKIESVLNAIETTGGTAAQYNAALAAAGVSAGQTLTTALESRFIGVGEGVVSHSWKHWGLDIGANLKALKAQVYGIGVGTSFTVPTSAATSTFVVPTCTGCYLVDADGSGFGIDLAISGKTNDSGPLKNSRASLVVRNLFAQVDVSGTIKGYNIVDDPATAAVDYKLQETAVTGTYDEDITISPEITLGYSGDLDKDLHFAIDTTIDTDDASIGFVAGVEKDFGVISLRGGLGRCVMTESFCYSGGIGLDIKSLVLDVAYGKNDTADANGDILAASFRLEF